ncbi:tryptophan--tRNA ligase [Malassezia furfur]|uniref:Tryptophanyl-tRNA synthetase n=1 Tax=Malassezia furfur TaxID=55194 RepID=A0ABY8ERU3_MALFU|nr:tryptophan--tRNA ligase [Malassezia furfur]
MEQNDDMESLAKDLAKTSVVPDGSAPATTADTAQKVTPWDVEGGYVDGKQVSIDYNKLIKEFGTKPIDAALLERFERLTGRKPHPLLRRGSFFSHRYVTLAH